MLTAIGGGPRGAWVDARGQSGLACSEQPVSRYILRRLALMIPVAFLASVILFLLLKLTLATRS